MRTLFAIALLLGSAVGSNARWPYLPTRSVDSSDTYWGMTSKDPYRWLENMEENEVTFRNFADQYSFGLWQTGHPDFQPSNQESGQ